MDLLVVWLLLMGSAYFAGTELAVTMASRVRLRTLAEEGSHLAALAENLLHHPERAIAICLVGNNLVNVAIAVYGREALLHHTTWSPAMVDTVSTFLLVPLVLLFGEIIPKAIAQSYPNRELVWAVVPLMIFRILLAPLLIFALIVADGVRRLCGSSQGVLEFASREELKQFVARSEVRGHVDTDERDLIYQIFEFWKRNPESFVRALDDFVCIPENATAAEAKALLQEKKLNYLPVINESGSDVVGVVDLAKLLSADNATPITHSMNRPVRADLTLGLGRVLSQLQRSTSRLAVVRSETGTGIIVMDDLLVDLLGS